MRCYQFLHRMLGFGILLVGDGGGLVGRWDVDGFGLDGGVAFGGDL